MWQPPFRLGPCFNLKCEPHPRYMRCRHSCLPVTTRRHGAPVCSFRRVPRFSSLDPCGRGVPSTSATDHLLSHPTNATDAVVWAPYTTATL